jgi:hypothetical protein
MLAAGLSLKSFAQTFSAMLKFYRRNCGRILAKAIWAELLPLELRFTAMLR